MSEGELQKGVLQEQGVGRHHGMPGFKDGRSEIHIRYTYNKYMSQDTEADTERTK